MPEMKTMRTVSSKYSIAISRIFNNHSLKAVQTNFATLLGEEAVVLHDVRWKFQASLNSSQHYTTLYNIIQHYTTLCNIMQHYTTL